MNLVKLGYWWENLRDPTKGWANFIHGAVFMQYSRSHLFLTDPASSEKQALFDETAPTLRKDSSYVEMTPPR
jgi:hypothetical protein